MAGNDNNDTDNHSFYDLAIVDVLLFDTDNKMNNEQ